MKVYFLFSIVVCLVSGCRPQKSDESVAEIASRSSIPHLENPKTQEIFNIKWKELFDRPFDTSQIDCYVPTDFIVRGDTFLIANKIEERIDAFDLNGRLVKSI